MPLFMYLWFIFILSDNFCTLVSLLSIKPLYFDHNFDFFDFIFSLPALFSYGLLQMSSQRR